MILELGVFASIKLTGFIDTTDGLKMLFGRKFIQPWTLPASRTAILQSLWPLSVTVRKTLKPG